MIPFSNTVVNSNGAFTVNANNTIFTLPATGVYRVDFTGATTNSQYTGVDVMLCLSSTLDSGAINLMRPFGGGGTNSNISGNAVFNATAGQRVVCAISSGTLYAGQASLDTGPEVLPLFNLELFGGNGPTGQFGPQGIAGPTGITGPQGTTGATGPTGGSSYTNWENDLLRTDNSVTNSINPTLTNILDINNFVHEVIIEFYVTQSPQYLGIGFNEVYSDVIYVARSISQTYGVYYDINTGSGGQSGLGFNTALVFVPGSGECKFRLLLSPHRTFRNAGQGSSVQNLGVLAQGEFTYMERVIDNTTAPTKMSTFSFAKYALGTPLIDLTQSTAALSNINYISIWCSSNIAAIKNYRIRTRKYANISRD